MKFKNTDVYIIKNFEDIITINDEHITITTNLYYSKFKMEYENEINEWKEKMENISYILEKWTKLQIN